MKRIWLGILVLLLFAAGGCQKQTEKTDTAPIVVGFSQLGSESSWRIANTQSISEAAKAYGYDLMMSNANQKQEKQIAAIRSFISYRVDVIVFSPIVETGWDNVLTEAKKAGIPVILMDRMIETDDETLYTAFVGADCYLEGRRAGDYLLRWADVQAKPHYNIVELSGTVDSTPMRERQHGFMDVIDGDARFTVLESLSGDFLRSKGEECMKELLDRYSADQIDVIYSHNDAMTLGVLDVLQARGIEPGKDIMIISVDGEKAAVDALKAGKINCIVQCTPHLGEAVMELVTALKQGNEVPKISYPDEKVFSDFDDLTAPSVEGF
ncbi:MAG: ABC transporter substrate-binding protein [Clostridia bacterium]|nr:ABC transporter substrate-binding protein [Clostridia bacterium]